MNSNCFSPSAAAAAEGSEFGLPPPSTAAVTEGPGGAIANCELFCSLAES